MISLDHLIILEALVKCDFKGLGTSSSMLLRARCQAHIIVARAQAIKIFDTWPANNLLRN